MSFVGDAIGGVFDSLGMGPKSGQVKGKYNASGGHPGDYAYNAFTPTPVTIGENPNGSIMNIPGTAGYDPGQGSARAATMGPINGLIAPLGMQPGVTYGGKLPASFGYGPGQPAPDGMRQTFDNQGGIKPVNGVSPVLTMPYPYYQPTFRSGMADGGPVFNYPTNTFSASGALASAANARASNASAAQSGFNAQAIKDNFVAQAIKNNFNAQAIKDNFQAQNQQSDYNVNAPTNQFNALQAGIDTSNYQNTVKTAQGQAAGGAGPTQGTIDQMQGLGPTLQDQMAGRGPSLAQLQLQQALSQNAAQNASLIGGQKGINAGLAARGIASQTAAANQGAVNQSAQIRAQEQLNATNQYQALLNQIGQTQLGQQQAGTQALATAGGLQNQQGANQIQNLQQQQQLNQATAAQNANMNLQGQLANQQQSVANAQLRQQAQEVNANTAALNANLAQAAQQINAQTAAQNADLANSAQQMNWSTSQLNANLANAAQQMNWQTSLSNAQMRTQVNLANADNQTRVSMANASNQTNVNLANQQSRNWATGVNAGVAAGNQAAQLSTNQLNQNTALAQAGLNMQYQQMLAGIASQNAGLAGQAQGVNAGIGINNANNQQAWGSGLLGMGAGMFGMAAFSDERLKTNIKRSKTKQAMPGVPEATFKYKGQPGKFKGVIAQDVERVRPDLVGRSGGFKTVPAALGPRRQMAEGGAVDPMSMLSMFGGMAGGKRGGNTMVDAFLKGYGMAQVMGPQMPPPADPYGVGLSPTGYMSQAATGAPGMANGGFAGQVPGAAPYPGQDRPENDIVPIDASPGEIMLPLSVTQSANPPEAAKRFVANLQGKQGMATGGIAGELPPSYAQLVSQRRDLFKQLGTLRKQERAYCRGGKIK